MSRLKRKTVASCYECAALAYCYHTKNPDLTRDEGRRVASQCHSLHKGVTTETIHVEGKDRGMSRKKAEKLITKGRAIWADYGLLRIHEQGPVQGP